MPTQKLIYTAISIFHLYRISKKSAALMERIQVTYNEKGWTLKNNNLTWRKLGDDWKVQCSSSSTKHWLREEPVQFVHVDTKYYLSSSAQHKYGQPIPGQLEVAAAKSSSKNTKWMAQVTQEMDTVEMWMHN